MKRLKSVISILCAFSMLMCFPFSASASKRRFNSYNCDLDNIRYVGAIKDQGNEGNCILNALMSVCESYVIKNFKDSDASFSVDYIEKFLGSTNEYEKIKKDCIDIPLTYDDDCYAITGIDEVKPVEGVIKCSVAKNGAVLAIFGIPISVNGMEDSNCYSEKNASFYGNGDAYFHAVSIVGWDDSYSRDNFADKPETDGAWICQNSYGEDYGKNGFFYLSYAQDIELAAKVTVTQYTSEGEICEAAPQWNEDWQIKSVSTVYATIDSNKNKAAYALTEDGKVLDCSFIKDHTTGLYVLKLPEETEEECLYYFDENTVVLLNGDCIKMGRFEDNNSEYEIARDGSLHITVKETGGTLIKAIKVPKYDLGYIRFVYDDGSELMILAKDFEKKGINVIKYNTDQNPFPADKYENEPELGDSEYYCVITFNNEKYKFANKCEYIVNGKESKSYAFEGEELIVTVRSLIAEISKQGIIGMLIANFFSIFGNLAFIINSTK